MSHCSEKELEQLAKDLAQELKPGDRVLLEGPMGVGKTTLARHLLKALKINQPPEGSPTFAIAHEYTSPSGDVAHLDFYRLKSEEDIEEAGILTYYWERKMIVISEWLSLWPKLETEVLESGKCWSVRLDFETDDDLKRKMVIKESPSPFH